MFDRLKSSLILTPAILLLLVWIGTFSGMETVAKLGITKFMFGALVASLLMSYCVTLYVAFVSDQKRK
jgi:hypothetical protein